MENLLVSILIGVVVFVIYLVNSSKKREIKEKNSQNEFNQRLDKLRSSLETEVTIKTDIPEKVETLEEIIGDVEHEVTRFQAKRNIKNNDKTEEEII